LEKKKAMNSGANVLQKINIQEIKDGVVTLKGGALRAVLMVSSINFSLKSTEEQDAIILRYQEFLNSLDFPVQILIMNRKFDISEYLAGLEQKRNEQENELLKIQATEYIDFVRGLTQLSNIMSTFFYVIVPYAQTPDKKAGGMLSSLGGLFSPKNKQTAEKQTQEQMRASLWQRVEFVASGLHLMGLRTAVLNDDELLELFYRNYNPGAKDKPKFPSQEAKDKIVS